MRDERLDMRDIREVADAQHRLGACGCGDEHGNPYRSERQGATRDERPARRPFVVMHGRCLASEHTTNEPCRVAGGQAFAAK